LITGYVELSQPASLNDVRSLIKYATSDASRSALDQLVGSHAEQVMSVRLSILDILERHGDLDIPFPAFLQMLPSMRIRQYSISSSPLWDPRHITLTVSVIHAPALADQAKRFEGVASSYLAELRKGDRVAVSVRPSNVAFHLPEDPLTPIVMFCAGSGIAPMRGFVQERAVQKQSGRAVGKMQLFYGCRSPEMDFLYSNTDLKEWIGLGIIEVYTAFSQQVDDSQGCKYIQE
jgi:cytochrome P450/NADPH-cytochrome P450 reductase